MKYLHQGVTALIILTAASAASAETWKCTFANGETQYTAVPSQGAECSPINISKTTGAAPTPAPPTPAVPAAATETPPTTPARNADIDRINRENCERAQANLKLLSSSTRIRLKDGDEYRVIPEEERQQKMALAKQQIDTYCK